MNNSDIPQQAVGIDIASNTLQMRLGSFDQNGQYQYSTCQEFANKEAGFKQMLSWLQSRTDIMGCWFVMEATGVYYEQLAYFLHHKGLRVCVLVARRAKHWAKSLPIKSKTDQIDARLLARYGLERRPQRWRPTSEKLRQIKMLLRERQQLKKQQTQLKNRLHAARKAWDHPQSSIERMIDHIHQISDYITEIAEQLERLWQSEEQLAEPIQRIAEIGGVGTDTVLTVAAETNGFALITNRNQLASYSGLDVVMDQSGKRQGPTKISKQGNTHIRRALYMPALSAIQHNKALKAFYQRLLKKCSDDNRKKAVTAVMRKLLLLIYSLWKSGQPYDPDFHYQQITSST